MTPHPGHPDRARQLSLLARQELKLFHQSGRRDALDTAIDHARAAVDAATEDGPRTGYLIDLVNGLRHKYKLTQDVEVLRQLVETYQTAVEVVPAGDPRRPGLLFNASRRELQLFKATGRSDLLIQAVRHGRDTIDAVDPDDPRRADYHLAATGALYQLWVITSNEHTRRELVRVIRLALDAAADDNPNRAVLVEILAAVGADPSPSG